MERLRQLIHEIHRRSLWQVLGSFRLTLLRHSLREGTSR